MWIAATLLTVVAVLAVESTPTAPSANHIAAVVAKTETLIRGLEDFARTKNDCGYQSQDAAVSRTVLTVLMSCISKGNLRLCKDVTDKAIGEELQRQGLTEKEFLAKDMCASKIVLKRLGLEVPV